MKKLISMLVLLAMLMAMVPAVFAAEENALVLGSNTLTSGTTYTYTVPETTTGRLEFDNITVKSSTGSTIYWYSYNQGTRAKITINGSPITAFTDQKVSVSAGDTVSVYVESIDGDTYTVTLTLSEIAPATPMALGMNNIAEKVEYSYTAQQDGTLYVSVVEMICDGASYDDSALNDYYATLKINGSTTYSFEKSYTVAVGDEVTVWLEPYYSSSVSAVVNLSYEGFYEHPVGTPMNPVYLTVADCPTDSIEIAAGSTAWYELDNYYDESAWTTVYAFNGYDLIVTGENAYVIMGSTRYDAVDGVVTVPVTTTTLIQIGNDGDAAATFQISYSIPEGHKDNPQDLVIGDNAKTLPSYSTYYFDFDAGCGGTATAVISGENWRYDYWHLDADGTQMAYGNLYAKNGDSDTLTLELTAGQRLVIMLGTSKGYSQPGGDLNINFSYDAQHQFGDYVSDGNATCTEDGTKTATCAVCGATDTVADEGSALGHDYESVTVEPTCTEEGSVTHTCTVCGDTYTEVIEATGHDYDIVVTDPTCTEQGYSTYTCACGDTFVDDFTDALGHSYESVTVEPTCTEEGSITYTCTACGDTYAEVIEATGHTAGDAVTENVVPATCTADGSHDEVIYCTVCDAELGRQTVTDPATGHTAGETVTENVVPATCTADGSHDEVVYCATCNEELSRVTVTDPATGHDFADGVCGDCGAEDPDYEEPTEAPTEEPTEAPTEAPTEKPTQKPGSNVPTTGDPIMMFIASALVSGMGITALVSKKKEF